MKSKLRLAGKWYDVQLFSHERLDRDSLVYTNPKRRGLNPYDRLNWLFQECVEPGTFRVIAARPGAETRFWRVFLFSFYRQFSSVAFNLTSVSLKRHGTYIRESLVNYHDGEVQFFTTNVAFDPFRHGRMEGVYIADVAEDYRLYFGYAEANATERDLVFDYFQRPEKNPFDTR